MAAKRETGEKARGKKSAVKKSSRTAAGGAVNKKAARKKSAVKKSSSAVLKKKAAAKKKAVPKKATGKKPAAKPAAKKNIVVKKPAGKKAATKKKKTVAKKQTAAATALKKAVKKVPAGKKAATKKKKTVAKKQTAAATALKKAVKKVPAGKKAATKKKKTVTKKQTAAATASKKAGAAQKPVVRTAAEKPASRKAPKKETVKKKAPAKKPKAAARPKPAVRVVPVAKIPLAPKPLDLDVTALGSSASFPPPLPPAVSSAAPPKPPAPRAPVAEPTSVPYIDRGMALPEQYGMDRLTALVRDPRCVFCYWELTGGRLDELRARRGGEFVDSCAWLMRIHCLDNNSAEDLEIDPSTGSWYFEVGKSGRYQFEMALLAPDGEFVSLLASQTVVTPAEAPSDVFDEEWRLVPEAEKRLAELSPVPFGVRTGLPSSLPSSGGLGGASWGGARSGRPTSASWSGSFFGASGRPTSAGDSGSAFYDAAGRLRPVLVRPTREGGPNWNEQKNLPRKNEGPAKTAAARFKVKLPRVVYGVPRPQPSWPPGDRGVKSPADDL